MDRERLCRTLTACLGCMSLLLALAWVIWECVSVAVIIDHQP
jgi:hypothetical protein